MSLIWPLDISFDHFMGDDARCPHARDRTWRYKEEEIEIGVRYRGAVGPAMYVCPRCFDTSYLWLFLEH